jgi:ABC-type branched-subunit amino acid transport system substrate-binding protein
VIAARTRRGAALVVVLLAACNGAEAPRLPRGVARIPHPSSTPPPAITIPVVVPSAVSESAGPYLDGMQLAAEVARNAGGPEIRLDVREPEDPITGILGGLQARPAALFVLADGDAVVATRTEIERTHVPVVLVGDDLYSGRALFRYAFQTQIPVRWQARILAQYLVDDRGYRNVALVTEAGSREDVIREAFAAAFVEEGRPPPGSVSVDPSGAGLPVSAFKQIDAAVLVAGTGASRGAVEDLAGRPSPPQVALSSAALHPAVGTPPPGTVVTAPYTWAGWADMLPRVHSFRERFAETHGHPPVGPEQEGYDAVAAVAEALERTSGRGGDALVRMLESFRDETYSSIPVRLGPDDHVLAEQSQLGLFTVEVPGAPAPGETLGPVPWRPIMRTFTTDGEKVNILDRDKKVFFPFWHEKRPSPKYWRSRYGIVTRTSDPLH